MINKTDILNLVHGLTGPRPLIKRELVSPNRDWWIMLFIFAAIVIAGSAWLTLRYMTYQSVDQLVGGEATQVPRYRESQVLDVLETFRTRNTKYVSLVNDKPDIVSLPEETASSTDLSLATTTDTISEPD